MQTEQTFPIGIPGQKWGEPERQAWRALAQVKRLYSEEVLPKIEALKTRFEVEQYGALSYDPARFPLYCIKSKHWDTNKPTVLISGGVHGYETSGVQGALAFLDQQGEHYSQYFNLVVAPCVSPWGYETINRWNPLAIDPNRSFYANSPAEESAALWQLAQGLGEVLVHIDLHETTDTDETEFRPALAARDGITYEPDTIPDGFYTVGDSENPQLAFQAAVIDSVAKVTHIAPADKNGQLIGSDMVQNGVILYPMTQLGLSGNITQCQYHTTTEVYPDSPKVTDDECNRAQVAAIMGGLDYVLAQRLK
ncbi:hypothetical protein VST7929_01078 [Vibrio stylophorae]|uniref:Peptidase M14 domain-containing protein n=1 Tax=Vibrio stylophorae TaxID=659351 RepID=A0ABM8ZSE1_9VIBR|nr:M14 family metallocarboxypeptidase [Vibrio stylophorae]CAH0533214.1 hypothetical protein VST7929_01078 [Vibrio stylophorae]